MKIGYFSSSTPITYLSPKRFQRAKDFLTSKGIELQAGSLTKKSDFYRSGSIQARADEINQLIHDETIDVLMATIGGLVTNSILEKIDYDYLQKHPKTIVGYSDATALLLAISTQAPACKIFYGPALVASFGDAKEIIDYTWQSFEQVLNNQEVELTAPKFWTDEAINWEDYQRPKKMVQNQWHYIKQPILEGRIVGGNLNTMSGFLGSKYFPKYTENDLLFIEDAEKDASIVEKNFSMLKNFGTFDQVKGVILGKHALFDDLHTGRKPIDILLEVLGNRDLPIIYDFDSCHTVPMMTTPIGAWARFDATKMQVTYRQS
ncbi:LD-carboxypeptidase [Companilactobacillus farciminis]|nr:LD-carboxypeptidase [Companilactobacillus farciminis]